MTSNEYRFWVKILEKLEAEDLNRIAVLREIKNVKNDVERLEIENKLL